MKRSIQVWLVVILVLVGGSLGEATETHPFEAKDLVSMDRVSDPQVSPDGASVVFVRRVTDLEADKGRTDLWSVGMDGEGLRRLTTSAAADHSPRWDADGSAIYFLSTRSGSSQVWKLRMSGGEAEQVSDLPLDVGGFAVSPDGGQLVVALDVFVDCDSLECTTQRLADRDEGQVSGRIYDRLLVRHWDVWKDGRRSHLFAVPTDGGEAVDLMKGMDADAPSKPWGGMEEVAFTPDGTSLVFTARVAGEEEAWSTNFDLWLTALDGSATPQCLTSDNDAWDTQPVFSPDGSSLVYLAMTRPRYEADRFRIMVRDWPDGEPREVAPDWDRSAGSLFFSADGKTLFTVADDTGQNPLFAIDVATGSVETLVSDGHVRSASLAGDRLVFGRDDLRSPVDLFSAALDGSDVTRLTSVNDEALSGIAMGETEHFSFAGWNGETVWAWVVKPADFDPERTYPIAFLIHGGPQGSFGNDFHYRWNPQIYAGAGYAAIMVDFHGSTGYGQDFTDAIGKDWGGKPLVDLQKGLAAALERYPWMDGERTCALGASYGGYMINWIAGAWSDRFDCLVNHDGIFDQRMMYYATEELWFPEWEQGGPYWQSAEIYERDNPANLVDKWQTPMLVVHGALDYRVPETQGLATFTALQRRGIPSRLLHFPDENHFVLRPSNSVMWHDTVLDWLAQWTAAEGSE